MRITGICVGNTYVFEVIDISIRITGIRVGNTYVFEVIGIRIQITYYLKILLFQVMICVICIRITMQGRIS